MSSHSSHHDQAFLLPQFSLYVHKSGLKPDTLGLGRIKRAGVGFVDVFILMDKSMSKYSMNKYGYRNYSITVMAIKTEQLITESELQ